MAFIGPASTTLTLAPIKLLDWFYKNLYIRETGALVQLLCENEGIFQLFIFITQKYRQLCLFDSTSSRNDTWLDYNPHFDKRLHLLDYTSHPNKEKLFSCRRQLKENKEKENSILAFLFCCQYNIIFDNIKMDTLILSVLST